MTGRRLRKIYLFINSFLTMKKLFNKTIQKLRLLIFRYMVTISEETTRFIHLRFSAFSKDKHIYIYKVNVWFLKIISRLEVTA